MAFDPQKPEPFNFKGPTINRFLKRYVKNLGDYKALFQGVSNEKAIGEATADYLYWPDAPKRIKEYIPDVKLIGILRDPVERAYSAYWHMRRDGFEWLQDFSQAIEESDKRTLDNWVFIWRYKEMGLYSRQIQNYLQFFDSSQIKIYLYEDFSYNPNIILKDIFQFLNVDDTFIPNTSIMYNVSGSPKNRNLQKILTSPHPFLKKMIPFTTFRKYIQRKAKELNLNPKPKISPELRHQILPFFREDILNLQQIINRDLSSWLREAEDGNVRSERGSLPKRRKSGNTQTTSR